MHMLLTPVAIWNKAKKNIYVFSCIYRFLAPFSTAVEIYGGGEPVIK
jgi:hypothetical protein